MPDNRDFDMEELNNRRVERRLKRVNDRLKKRRQKLMLFSQRQRQRQKQTPSLRLVSLKSLLTTSTLKSGTASFLRSQAATPLSPCLTTSVMMRVKTKI